MQNVVIEQPEVIVEALGSWRRALVCTVFFDVHVGDGAAMVG